MYAYVYVCVCVCVCGMEMRRVHRRTRCYDGERREHPFSRTSRGKSALLIARRRHGRGQLPIPTSRESGLSRLSGEKGEGKKRGEKQRERSLADDDALDPSETKHQRNRKLGDRERERERERERRKEKDRDREEK